MNRAHRVMIGALPAALAGGFAATFLFSGGLKDATAQDATRVLQEDRATATSLEGAFMKIADTVGPATVSIQAQVDAPDPRRSGPDDESDPFDLLPSPRRAPRARTSIGSGVIVHSGGYILTNDHVVEGARDGKVSVKMSDGTLYSGTVSRDPRSDLAVVKIDAGKPLPYVRFADSDALKVGQWAVAIGSPFGKENTMTTGIVSALHRKTDISDGPSGRYYPSLIQTDAAINRGNSGGPLLNIKGELIGINVAIFSPTGTSTGIGFAIPANTAHLVMDQLISRGKVVRGSLGVVPEDVPVDLRSSLDTTQGAYIRQVTIGGPADKAGIQAGDVITRFNGRSVTDENALREAIAAAGPAADVRIDLLRARKPLTLSATLGQLRETPVPAPSTSPTRATPAKPAPIGFQTSPITPDLRERLSLPKGVDGMVVTAVEPGSPADDAGIRPGAIVTTVNGKPVASKAAFDAALDSARSGELLSLKTIFWIGDSSGERSLSRGIATIRIP